MNVLSLFDGMSCGQIALNRSGIKYNKYFASEIDKKAIQVTQKNFPSTIQLGDVRMIKGKELPTIHLLLGGSPCQGFSSSGKGLNFDDPRSKLFFEFVRLLNETKPKYFLLENVKMDENSKQIITDYLGVEPIEINSSLVSAQNRVRLYWTNLPGTSLPANRGITLKDILETKDHLQPSAIRGRKLNKATILGRRINASGKREDNNQNIPYTQCLEVRNTNTEKCNCLTTVAKDNVLTSLPIGRYPDAFINKLPFRYYSSKELCRLQTVPENYFEGMASDNQIRRMLGNGWTIDVIVHLLSPLKSGLQIN